MTRLTDHDREILDNAGKLRDLANLAGICEHTGEDDTTAALAVFAGEARHVITELVSLVSRLTKDTDDDQ